MSKTKVQSQDENQLAYFDRDKLIWGSCLKSNEKLLLHALNSFVGADGRCFPKHNLLAEMTSFSRSSVVRVMKSLEESGVVQVEWRYRPDGSQSSNDYFLDWEALKALNYKGVLNCNRGVSKSNTRVSNSDTGGSNMRQQELPIQTDQVTIQVTAHNIDTFSGGKSDTGETQFKNGLANDKKDSGGNGSVSPEDQNPDSCGGGETHETQNETVEPPKRKVNWQPGQTLYYDTDQNDRIIYPSIKDIHPTYKPHYSKAIAWADRQTKAWIINNGFVDSVSVETDDDGDLYVDTLNDEYTPEEALSEIPLAQLFQLGIHPDHGSLSTAEYNEYWAGKFIAYMTHAKQG